MNIIEALVGVVGSDDVTKEAKDEATQALSWIRLMVEHYIDLGYPEDELMVESKEGEGGLPLIGFLCHGRPLVPDINYTDFIVEEE